MGRVEERLPSELLARSSLRGNEYAWRLADIPAVIKAGRAASLASIGGQLQLRLPDGSTCECYWLEVDASKAAQEVQSWPEHVAETAEIALAEFKQLLEDRDFLAAARTAFPTYVAELEAAGTPVADVLWFVWYLKAMPMACC